MEEAAFAMREELKEAEAAVEECYRRRAKRARLAMLLPADRPMREKELDTPPSGHAKEGSADPHQSVGTEAEESAVLKPGKTTRL